MTKVSITIQPESVVQLRRLSPQDIPRIKELCQQWFPIQYPELWFEDITSSPRFFSLGAVLDGQLVGVIVSEIKPQFRCNREDQGLVARGLGREPLVAYILSLGVVLDKRRNGIGSLLLQQLIQHLTSDDSTAKCQAIFLHVLSSNSEAIQFYESQKFTRHQFLPLYYFVGGKCLDGISYVRLVLDVCAACPYRLFRGLSHVGHFLNWKLVHVTKFPSRITHRIARNLKPSPTVKYHQVASA